MSNKDFILIKMRLSSLEVSRIKRICVSVRETDKILKTNLELRSKFKRMIVDASL